MGMAASQARYLGLAARKNNVEYQGQQINQARTALGNQSAELWNQMLGMAVPVCPDQTDFSKLQYSFSDGQNAFEITSMVPSDEDDEYNYTVEYRYFEKEIKGIENTNTNPQVQLSGITSSTAAAQTITVSNGKYSVNSESITPKAVNANDEVTRNRLKDAGVIANLTDDVYSYELNGNMYYVSGTVPTATASVTPKTLSATSIKLGNTEVTKITASDITSDPNIAASLLKIAEDNADTQLAKAINAAYTASKDWSGDTSTLYTYVKNGTTYFACKGDIENSLNNSSSETPVSTIDNQASMKQYYPSMMDVEKTMTDRALMDDASGTGRFSSIKLKNYNTTFNLNVESTINEEAYNQAMNQYYYDTQQYDKKLADINAKTSLIHSQDRTLELRLKQLDTEHNALQNEMEAVKKVMDKNVEDTFKTFNG